MKLLKEYSTVELLVKLENVPKGSVGTIVLIQANKNTEQTYSVEFNGAASGFELLNVPQSKLKVINSSS